MNSLQIIFNAAYKAFVLEGKPPAVQDRKCCYLTHEGNKCAVGLCIPDGHPAQESTSTFAELRDEFPDLFPDLINVCRLNYFQSSLHDDWANLNTGQWKISREELKEKYLKVAQKYNLTVPE